MFLLMPFSQRKLIPLWFSTVVTFLVGSKGAQCDDGFYRQWFSTFSAKSLLSVTSKWYWRQEKITVNYFYDKRFKLFNVYGLMANLMAV